MGIIFSFRYVYKTEYLLFHYPQNIYPFFCFHLALILNDSTVFMVAVLNVMQCKYSLKLLYLNLLK